MGIFKRAKKDLIDASVLLTGFFNDQYIDRKKAMEISAFSSCANKISDTIAGLHLKLYREHDGKIEEVKKDYRLFLLNDETGDTLNAFEFKKALVMDYLLGKGGYAFIQKDGLSIRGLYYVDDNNISFMSNNDPIFKSYKIIVNAKEYYDYEFIKILRNTKNGYQGVSLIDEHQESLKTIFTTLKFEKNLVSTGGHKKGFLESEKKLTADAIATLREGWQRLYGDNDEKVLVLNDGVKFKEAGNTSVEMQLNEKKITNSDDICKMFGVTPSFINGNLTQEDEKANMKYCFNPILTNIETALNSSLLLESEKGSYFFEFDTTELTKSDIDKRFRSYKTAIESGFMTIDEVRYRENLEEIGFPYLKLSLADGLYIPNQHKINVLNTGSTIQMKGGEDNEDRS